MGMHAGVPWMRGGFIGVDLFLVLSGFLITVLLLEEWDRTGSISLKSFYVRRALRLLPALVTCLVVCCAYAFFFLDQATSTLYFKSALAALFYLSNWAWAWNWFPLRLPHTWSLSLEEQFYLLWPPLLIGLLRLDVKRRWKLLLVAAGILGSISLRTVLVFKLGWGAMRAHGCTDTRADGLLEGCLLALLLFWNILPRTRFLLVAFRVAMLASLVYLSIHIVVIGLTRFYLPHGLTLLTLAAAFLLAGLFYSPPALALRALGWPPLVWIGRRAYGLYLWHVPIMALPLPALGDPQTASAAPMEMAIRVALAFLIAGASFAWIEQPFLRRKTRWSRVPLCSSQATTTSC